MLSDANMLDEYIQIQTEYIPGKYWTEHVSHAAGLGTEQFL
jgi:hypothetical protein